MYKGLIKKSRTLDAATLLVVFGVIEQNLPLLREQLGDNYGLVFMCVGIIFALLRMKTTAPVGDK